MTVGAGGALNVIFKALLNPGDEVIIFAPYFVEYTFYVGNHGGVAVIAETNEDFTLNAEALEKRLAYLSSTLALPKLEAQDIANGLVSVGQEDLRLEFSVLRLPRSAAEEQVFVKMLLETEEDLEPLTEPMVSPW